MCTVSDMYKPQKTTAHTSIKGLFIWVDDDMLATLLSISTMALMFAGDSTTSAVKLTVTSLSSSKNSGSEVLVKNCDI